MLCNDLESARSSCNAGFVFLGVSIVGMLIGFQCIVEPQEVMGARQKKRTWVRSSLLTPLALTRDGCNGTGRCMWTAGRFTDGSVVQYELVLLSTGCQSHIKPKLPFYSIEISLIILYGYLKCNDPKAITVPVHLSYFLSYYIRKTQMGWWCSENNSYIWASSLSRSQS